MAELAGKVGSLKDADRATGRSASDEDVFSTCPSFDHLACEANDQHRTENTVTRVRSTLSDGYLIIAPALTLHYPASSKDGSIMYGYKSLRKGYLLSSSKKTLQNEGLTLRTILDRLEVSVGIRANTRLRAWVVPRFHPEHGAEGIWPQDELNKAVL